MMLALNEERILPKIHPVTRETLDLFIQKVLEQEKENLKKIILFGSVARGEANEDSDIDVLVILGQMTVDDRVLICNIGYDVKWNMDFHENAYLQPVIVSEEETRGLAYWELMQKVVEEGVCLYDAER